MGTSSWLATSRMRRSGLVLLVVDLHNTHDRFGSSSDRSLNGHLHYPSDIDRSLNEAACDKIRVTIRKYRVDYDNNPLNVISFIDVSGCVTEYVWGTCVDLSPGYLYLNRTLPEVESIKTANCRVRVYKREFERFSGAYFLRR